MQLCSSGALVRNVCTCCCCSNFLNIIDYLNIYLSSSLYLFFVYVYLLICLCMLVVVRLAGHMAATTTELLVIWHAL